MKKIPARFEISIGANLPKIRVRNIENWQIDAYRDIAVEFYFIRVASKFVPRPHIFAVLNPIEV